MQTNQSNGKRNSQQGAREKRIPNDGQPSSDREQNREYHDIKEDIHSWLEEQVRQRSGRVLQDGETIPDGHKGIAYYIRTDDIGLIGKFVLPTHADTMAVYQMFSRYCTSLVVGSEPLVESGEGTS